MTGALPVIVSYYTDGPYAVLADRLRLSCKRLKLPYDVVRIEARASWEVNTHVKAEVCLAAWQRIGRPILWVDADAIVHSRPELLRGETADVGVHRWLGEHFAGGTLFFNQTARAGQLLDAWVAHCPSDLTVSDQWHLERTWEAIPEITTVWLPRSYCQIFDAKREDGAAPVIEHFQASRLYRRKASPSLEGAA